MKKTLLSLTVNEAAEKITKFLLDKDFVIFADINHQVNAQTVNLDMPESRVIIFGNPIAGTKLMQKDIFMSFDLPLRLAVVESKGETYLLHNTTEDYNQQYDVEAHPVLNKVEELFSGLTKNLSP